MKVLHMMRSEPDEITRLLKELCSEGEQNTEVRLYEGQPDYGRLIDLIFENDKVISWW